jgi:hypothetical protein
MAQERIAAGQAIPLIGGDPSEGIDDFDRTHRAPSGDGPMIY